MTSIKIEKVLPHKAPLLYGLVRDVASYPTFLPWCLDARVLEDHGDHMIADLLIGYGFLREKYTSIIHLKPFTKIKATCEDGPLESLLTLWSFDPRGERETHVSFSVEFMLRSKLLQRATSHLFEKGALTLMDAFEKKASISEQAGDS